jgi:hypothetical protein
MGRGFLPRLRRLLGRPRGGRGPLDTQIVVEVSGGSARRREEAKLLHALAEAAGEYEVSEAGAFRSKRKADAAALEARLPAMSAADREEAVAAFAAEYGPFGWELSDLEWTLEVLKAEEEGRSLEATGPIEGDIGEIVKIAIPTITGPLAARLINTTIDWARERVKRTQVPETITIYGPEGQLVRRVEVSWTGEVNDSADDV